MSKKIKILTSDTNKPNLHMLFHMWIDRVGASNASHGSSSDFTFEDWECFAQLGLLGIYPDEFDFDDCDLVFPYNSSGKSHKHMNDDDAYAAYWANEERKQHRKKNHSNCRDAEYVDYSEVGKRKHKKNKGKHKKLDLYTPYSGWEENPDEVGSGFDERERFDNHCIIYYYPNYNNMNDKLEFSSLKEFDDFCCDEGFVISPNVAEEMVYRPINHVCLYPQSRERGVYELYAGESYSDMVYEVCDLNELSK